MREKGWTENREFTNRKEYTSLKINKMNRYKNSHKEKYLWKMIQNRKFNYIAAHPSRITVNTYTKLSCVLYKNISPTIVFFFFSLSTH